MTSLYGKVLSVETRNLSEPVVAAASIGATSLVVADASTFDENGGVIVVNGEQLAYTATDVDTDTLTLAAALVTAVADQDLAEVFPATPVKTATVDLGEDGDPIPATVLHSLLDKLPDGIRVAGSEESVTIEQRGTYEFVVSDLVGETLTQQSLEFTEGEEGYGLTEAGVQMEDAQVTGELGAAVVSADVINLGGESLADILAPIPRSTRYALRGDPANINAGTTAGTTELRLFTFTVTGGVKAGHLYNVGFRALGTGTVAGDAFWCLIRYTVDGSEPTTSSPVMPGGQVLISTVNAGIVRAAINVSTFFPATADSELRFCISVQRVGGSGTLFIRTDAESAAVQVFCTDLGVDSDSATSLQQTAKTDGSGSDNVPVTTYVKTFSATWALGWGDYTNVQENSWFWTGVNLDYSSGAYGLIGFDYAAIVATLAASVTPVSCVLRVRPRSRRYGDGLDFRVLTHTNTSLANAHSNYWDTYQGDWHGNGSVYDTGVVKNNAAPNVPVDISLGTTIFNQFKAGSRRGVGIAGVSDTVNGSSGTIYGDGAYQAQLIFTYQG